MVYTTDLLHYHWLYNETLVPETYGFSDGYASALINTLMTRCVWASSLDCVIPHTHTSPPHVRIRLIFFCLVHMLVVLWRTRRRSDMMSQWPPTAPFALFRWFSTRSFCFSGRRSCLISSLRCSTSRTFGFNKTPTIVGTCNELVKSCSLAVCEHPASYATY